MIDCRKDTYRNQYMHRVSEFYAVPGPIAAPRGFRITRYRVSCILLSAAHALGAQRKSRRVGNYRKRSPEEGTLDSVGFCTLPIIAASGL